jgi:hypothetical protein
MPAFEGIHLEGNPEAQMAWRQRQIRITLAVLGGASVATLAKQEGVTSERIRQILRMACVHAIKLAKRKVQWPPMHDNYYWSMQSLRTHREFWRARMRALERVWKLPRTRVVKYPETGAGQIDPWQRC